MIDWCMQLTWHNRFQSVEYQQCVYIEFDASPMCCMLMGLFIFFIIGVVGVGCA